MFPKIFYLIAVLYPQDRQFKTKMSYDSHHRHNIPDVHLIIFLHFSSVVQPNNILLMTEHAYPEIKIIDFGLARQIKDGEQICLIVGTPEYVGECARYFTLNMHVDTYHLIYTAEAPINRHLLEAKLCS